MTRLSIALIHFGIILMCCQVTCGAAPSEVTYQTIDASAYQQSEYQPYSLEPSLSDEPMMMTTLVDNNYTGTNGQLRLVNGRSMYEGRLEIYYSGSWGTICDDDFDIRDARVACRQLGLLTLSVPRVYSRAYFGRGNGPIQLDDVRCFGTESRLSDCVHNGWRSHNCGHYEDVGIVCYPGIAPSDVTDQTIDVSAYQQSDYQPYSLQPSVSDDPMMMTSLVDDNTETTYPSTTSPFWYGTSYTTQTTWTQSPVSITRMHIAGTLINPGHHGANHCLRLVYKPRDRYANPRDLMVRFVPRDRWAYPTYMWHNTGEQSGKWYSHNHDLYIWTPGWIVLDDYNANGNMEIAEQTITRGTCDYIET